MPRRYLTPDEFRAAAGAGEDVSDAIVRQGFHAEVKADDNDDRRVRFTISSDGVDRMGDTISVDGWDLSNYRRNPVVLWAHDARSLPIARASDVRVEDGVLKATAEFAPAAANPLAESVLQLVRGRFLSATSVGFLPRRWRFSEDDGRTFGIDFEEQELLEVSIVPIPANPDALIDARGVDSRAVQRWARDVLGAGTDDVFVASRRLKELEAAEAELTARKAADLARPPPTQFPRLTERALAQLGIIKRG